MATSYQVPRIPDTSLALDTTVFFGHKHIRRVISRLNNVYLGDYANAQDFVIPPGLPKGIEGPLSYIGVPFRRVTRMIVLSTSHPIEVMATVDWEDFIFDVSQLLVLDSGVMNLVLTNFNQEEVSVHITSLESNDDPFVD